MVMAGNGFGFWNTMPMCLRLSVARSATAVDVDAVELHPSGQLGTGNELVHAIEDAEVGGLATARRADQGRHLVRAPC